VWGTLDENTYKNKDSNIVSALISPQKGDWTNQIGSQKEIMIKNPEQIHILGSKQDIEGFKKFTTQSSTSVEVKAFRTSGTFSSTVDYAQRGSGKYYALDKPFQELGRTDKVEEVTVSYNPSKTLDATTNDGQSKFIEIKRKAVEGKTFDKIKDLNDAVSQEMMKNGYEALIGLIDEDAPTVGRELVIYPTQPSTSFESDSTNIDTVSEPRRLGLKTTDIEGVFTYNDAGAKNTYYYLNLGKNNPNVVFLHNVSLYEIMPNQKDKGINLGGASNFMTEIPDMSVNFPTDLFISMKNGQKVEVSPNEYNTLKNIWEKRINLIKEIKEKGGKIAFPEYGFGNPKTMPQELFVYLSKRLFEEFQYLNPGSTMYNEIKEMVGITQGISDEEILIQLELEEDPFKCS